MFKKYSVIYTLSIFFNILHFELIDTVLEGTTAHSGEFPGIVYVMYTNDPDNRTSNPLCTGSLINELWVLTAGHCFREITNQPVYVIGGITDRNGEDPKGQIRFVQEIIIHPSYQTENLYSYDAALLKLWLPFNIGERVKPVVFPNNDIEKSMTMTFVGSGIACYGDVESTAVVHKYDLKMIEPKDCMEFFETNENIETVLCGVSINNFTAPCLVDSGGGLFIEGKQELGLYAILSFNDNCSSTSPAFFVSYRNILPWIKNITEVHQPLPIKTSNITGWNFDSGLGYWIYTMIILLASGGITWGILFCVKYFFKPYLPQWLIDLLPGLEEEDVPAAEERSKVEIPMLDPNNTEEPSRMVEVD